MDLDQLVYFKTLAEAENMTRAAARLSLTQPALSRSIARLEEELGVPLFERSVRGVTLTRYGKIFLEHADRAVQELVQAKDILQGMADPARGIISLAFIHTLGSNFVPNMLGEFRREYPNVRFQLIQDTTRRILELLEAGEVDIAFCSPGQTAPDVHAVPILEEELFLAVPKSHRLADREEARLDEVRDEQFVMYRPESGLRDTVDQLCREAGFQPLVSFEGVGDETIAGLVAAGFGVALIPRTPGLDAASISLLRVSFPRCRRVVRMVWKPDRYMPPAVQRFHAFVESRRNG